LHVEACRGALPKCAPEPGPPAAAEIVYAEREVRVSDMSWPDWTADRPRAGTDIAAGDPICTVLAAAATTEAAKALVADRTDTIRAQFDALQT
jgi:predicted ATP-grasp superfamily ATP-dependent carboligase